jgi:hypothetical protein
MLVADDTILRDAELAGAWPGDAAIAEWDSLAEPLQLTLATAALRRAAASIVFQAETLASEIEAGSLRDRGGPDALRLLATLIRVTSESDPI